MFEVFENTDPMTLFSEWLGDAISKEVNDPDAAALATVSRGGQPNVRMVLVRQADAKGFVFFTNSQSCKGIELAENRKAALCFHWKSLARQIRVRGSVEIVSDDISDSYFNSRHPVSRRGAIASKQSQPLANRATLETDVANITATYPDDEAIPRPDHWHGYRLIPQEIEFWQQGDNRLHDRFLFTCMSNGWSVKRLYP